MTGLVLIGLRGSGKTTAGRAAALRLGRPFFDLDLLIEARGRPIAEIFAAEGEAAFRALESEVIRTLDPPPGAIIATGGGAILAPENRVRLAGLGRVIYLSASPQVLAERVAQAPRPPLAGAATPLEEAQLLLEAREPLYRALSDSTLDTGELSLEQVVDVLVSLAVNPASARPTRER